MLFQIPFVYNPYEAGIQRPDAASTFRLTTAYTSADARFTLAFVHARRPDDGVSRFPDPGSRRRTELCTGAIFTMTVP